ncbi:MAG: hypothetical protein ACLGIA_04400, partial [Actinomycetes bacterium]
RMLDASPDEESARENLMDLISQTGVPEGGGYRDWLQGVHKRVLEAIRDPAPFLEEAPEEDGREPARLGEFHRKSEAAVWEIVDPVLDAHERQFEEWMTDRGGLYRQHYYLPDVGQQSGRVVMDFDTMERVPVRGAGVLVRWDARENKLVLEDLHPELSFDTIWRERFPDLCHVFGGYFGQRCADTRGHVHGYWSFLGSTEDPARSRIREQLDEFLALDDVDLAAALPTLGCALKFEKPRLWLRRMRWAMDAYQWRGPEALEPS